MLGYFSMCGIVWYHSECQMEGGSGNDMSLQRQGVLKQAMICWFYTKTGLAQSENVFQDHLVNFVCFSIILGKMLFDSAETGQHFIIISLSMVSAKQNRGRTEIMQHLNRVGSRQGYRSLKVVPGRKVVAEMEGILVGVISTV